MKLSSVYITFLNSLQGCNTQQRGILLKYIEVKQLQILVGIVHNILYGIISISSENKKVLKRSVNSIRRITEKGLTQKQRVQALRKVLSLLPIFINEYFKYESQNDINTGKIKRYVTS